MMHRLVSLTVVALVAVLASGADAQEHPRSPATGGWLGVQLVHGSDRAGEPVIHVAAVADGSPAHTAGLRAGDRIVELDGGPASPEAVARLTARLQPGDRVEVVVDREGSRRTFQLTASRRPPLPLVSEGRITPPRSPRAPLVRRPDRPDSLAGVVQLRREAVQLRDEARRVRIRQDSLQGGFRVQVDSMRFDWPPPEPPRAPTAFFGFVTGQRVVAGAEFIDLNPALGSYFGVERGLLVLEVLDDTPAHLAGLRPGDVVVEVAGEGVQSLEEFRRALSRSYRSPPVTLTLVREGERRRVELDR